MAASPTPRSPRCASSTSSTGCSSCSTARRWRSRTSRCNCSGCCSSEFLANGGDQHLTDRRRDLGRHRLGGDRRGGGPREHRHLHAPSRAAAVSDVQRRQMTTVLAPNVHNIAIEGTFRRCAGDGEARCSTIAAMARRFRLSRGQFDQLGAADGAGRLLFLRRGPRSARRDRAGRLRGADRQFRRRVRGLCRGADGAADRQADRRDQRQRHPPPRARRRATIRSGTVTPTAAPSMDIQVQLEFRAAAVRSPAAATARRSPSRWRGFEDSKAHAAAPTPSARAPAALFASARVDSDDMVAGDALGVRGMRRADRPAHRDRRSHAARQAGSAARRAAW